MQLDVRVEGDEWEASDGEEQGEPNDADALQGEGDDEGEGEGEGEEEHEEEDAPSQARRLARARLLARSRPMGPSWPYRLRPACFIARCRYTYERVREEGY